MLLHSTPFVEVPDTHLSCPVAVRSLTISDAEACELVENASFPDPKYRATREKFDYRLSCYPDLCYGLFIKVSPTIDLYGSSTLGTLEPDGPAEWRLVGHAVSTCSMNENISDHDMSVPIDWRTTMRRRPGSVAQIHSFAIVPALQKQGLGRKLMEICVEEMRRRKGFSSIALLCQDYLTAMYHSMGYKPAMSKSLATFGGGGWNDMLYRLDDD